MSKIFIETWKVKGNPNGNQLAIAYTEEQFDNAVFLNRFREKIASMYNCELGYLIRTNVIEKEESND